VVIKWKPQSCIKITCIIEGLPQRGGQNYTRKLNAMKSVRFLSANNEAVSCWDDTSSDINEWEYSIGRMTLTDEIEVLGQLTLSQCHSYLPQIPHWPRIESEPLRWQCRILSPRRLTSASQRANDK
jgi:hypothetical protein